jgi:hypothetical protein
VANDRFPHVRVVADHTDHSADAFINLIAEGVGCE